MTDLDSGFAVQASAGIRQLSFHAKARKTRRKPGKGKPSPAPKLGHSRVNVPPPRESPRCFRSQISNKKAHLRSSPNLRGTLLTSPPPSCFTEFLIKISFHHFKDQPPFNHKSNLNLKPTVGLTRFCEGMNFCNKNALSANIHTPSLPSPKAAFFANAKKLFFS